MRSLAEKQSELTSMSQWIIAFFSVAGAFFLCGIGGAFIASSFGFWELPVAGFCAAFSVVSTAYLSVPKFRNESCIIVFVVGTFAAWFILEPSYYPENYQELAYQPSHLPFISTIAGGIFGLIACLLVAARVVKSIVRKE